jgi:hypothetical protein
MDTKKLIYALKLIIQEEVSKEITKREKHLRASIIKELKQSQPPVVKNDPLDVSHIFENKQKPKKEMFKSTGFSDLLNETADSGEWRSINSTNGAFNSTQAHAWGHMTNQNPQVLQNVDGKAVSVEKLQQTEAGQAVVNALTRDYSSLMKTISAKKGK